jgi:hypothetical protein
MKATPISLTQDEVDALATGAKAASVVRRRLAAQKAPKPAPVARKAEKLAPQPLNEKELAALRAGRVHPSLRNRIFTTSKQPATPTEGSLGPKEAPSAAPRRKKK